MNQQKTSENIGIVCAFLTIVVITFLGCFGLLFYFGFLFSPPGSANDTVLENIWQGAKSAKVKKIKFSMVEIRGEQTLREFDQLLSNQKNFSYQAQTTPWLNMEDTVHFYFADGSSWKSHFVTWEQNGWTFIIRSLVPGSQSFFEIGHDGALVPYPPKVADKMSAAREFVSRFCRNYSLRLIIDDDSYTICRIGLFSISERKYGSRSEFMHAIANMEANQ